LQSAFREIAILPFASDASLRAHTGMSRPLAQTPKHPAVFNGVGPVIARIERHPRAARRRGYCTRHCLIRPQQPLSLAQFGMDSAKLEEGLMSVDSEV
jgi:hypothetical protein